MSTKRTPIPRTLVSLIEFVPILVFGYLGSAASADLRTRFLIGGGLALLVMVAQRVLRWSIDSLALSANVFLLLEGAAFITYIAPVAVALGFVRESAFFIVTLVVGALRTVASPGGFLDLAGGQTMPAIQGFQGTLTVQASTMFRARHGCAGLGETLAGFSVAFFTQGEHLVPVVRDFLDPPGIILSPGRVWSEPGDGGLSRARFPSC